MEQELKSKMEIDVFKEKMATLRKYAIQKQVADSIKVNDNYLSKVLTGVYPMNENLKRKLMNHFDKIKISVQQEQY